MLKKRKLWLVVLLCLIVAGWIGLDYFYRPRLANGPMVQMVEPAGFCLVWTPNDKRPVTVEVTEISGPPAGNVSTSAENGRQVTAVTGLQPGTSYRYRLCASAWGRQVILHEDTVHTAVPAGRPFSFLAFGDSGNGGSDQWRIANTMAKYDADLIIHTGDLVYMEGAAKDYPSHFYRPYASLIAHIPFYPSLGNHDFYTDSGRPFLDAFVLPRNGPRGQTPERDYWFDYGDVRFVAIDSNHDMEELGKAVAPWLDQVLANAGDRWKIVFFHEPVFTNTTHPPADKMELAIYPVIDKRRVQLVLCGHNHLYERTLPTRNGVPLPTTAPATSPASGDSGTVNIVTGAGGATLYPELASRPAYMAAWYSQRHSFTVVDVAGDHLRLRQINDLNELVDECVIKK